MNIFVIFGLLLFMSACETQIQELPTSTYIPEQVSGQIRPVIDKVPNPEYQEIVYDDIDDVVTVPELSTPIESYKLSVGYGLVTLNQTLGTFSPTFTKYDFPELLKSRNVKSDLVPIGGKYEQFLKLLGGRVIYTGDEYDVVDDYLVYRDDEPIYEYQFVFSDGSFLDYVGQEINILGNTYKIIEATKEDVILENLETNDRLVIGGGKILFNNEILSKTDSRMTGDSIFIIAKADALGDDIFISKGETLQEYLVEPTLITDKIDIRYLGVNQVLHIKIEFNNKGDELELRITEPYQETVRIPIGYQDFLGDEEGVLHYDENDDIKINDYFILTIPSNNNRLYSLHNNNETGLLSILLQYKGINKIEKRIEFVSGNGLGLELYYYNDTGTIPFAGRNFRFNIINDNLKVDLNGNGVFTDKVNYVFRNGYVIFENNNVILKLLNYPNLEIQDLIVEIINEGEFSLKPIINLEIFDLNRNDELAVSAFGTQFFFINGKGFEYEEIVIIHPLMERLAEILIETN